MYDDLPFLDRDQRLIDRIRFIDLLRRKHPLLWFTEGGTGGVARRGVETLDPNLRSVPVEIIDLKNAQPLNQKFRTKTKVFYSNFEEYAYMGTKLFA
jgi:hypothetical protein